MSNRSVYLAKYRLNANQRAHFAIFIPNATSDRANLSQNFTKSSCKGTIIHVVGEPIMSGYALEFKRNYECSSSRDLQALVFLGYVLAAHVFNPANQQYVKESSPRSLLEREAATVPPPPRGQDIRAPIDGIRTKRCQEWTMEYLRLLVNKALISPQAVDIAQRERDPPTHGIFGQRPRQ